MLIIEKSFVFLLWLSSILLSLTFIVYVVQPEWMSSRAQVSIASISTLTALFAHISTIFYFVGTGRWIHDQVDQQLTRDKEKAMRLWEIYRKANWLKSYSMPFPTLAIFAGFFWLILGGAVQVGVMDAWLHQAIALSFLIFTWAGLFLALKALKKNIIYLDLTSQELESE